jgi:hypothetical protein
MKNFNDLEFGRHRAVGGGIHARMDLADDMEISVVAGPNLYNDEGTYEIAVFDNLSDGALMHISTEDDVIGWQDEDEINTIMESIQTDPKTFRERCLQNKRDRDDY